MTEKAITQATKRPAQGKGTIRQRNDGRWEGRLTLNDGKKKSYYGKRRGDVVKQLTTSRHLLQQGPRRTGSGQRTGDYLDAWLEKHVKGARAPRTFESYELNMRSLKPDVGGIKLDQLRPADLQSAYTNCLRSHF